LFCSDVNIITIVTGILLNLAPILFGKKFSGKLKGSEEISVI